MSDVTSPSSPPAVPAVYTREAVRAHSDQRDAYIVIDNQVYNVTSFLEEHPGGAEILLDNAGKDASECFHDIGHSQEAREWMKQFHVGEVVDQDKWEIRKKETRSHYQEGDSVQALISAWLPPLGLAVIAALLYMYLF